MKLNAYTIFDSAPAIFNRPFFAQSDAEALRFFDDMVANAEHPIGQHPEHYTLFRIGTYEQNDGKLYPEDPSSLATATARKAAQQQIDPDSLTDENILKLSPGGTA